MFSESSFLIVKSDNLTDTDSLVQLLKSNNATEVYIKSDFDTMTNYLDPPKITHIITSTIDFVEYELAVKSMIPVTTSQWVHDCISQKKIQNIKPYNPDPKYFFHDCFICVADNLPEGDKEIIYGTASAFGSGYLDVLTKYTTHLIAVDLTNEKSIVANSVINSNIKIVIPEWIDHCVTLGRKLDEEDYLLPNPRIIHGELTTSPVVTQDSIPKETTPCQFLKGKKIYLSQDYNLSKRQTIAIYKFLESHQAIIFEKFSPDIDIYLGKYRHGEAYVESCKNSHTIVGTLAYLYNLVITNKWILPQNSQLLHYPIPITPIPQFSNLKISISNYSGDSRNYLSRLISIMGGQFTKTLTKENDYLVCAKPEGKKYVTAKEKWVDENGQPIVKIVNHIWIEECFVKWELQDWKLDKYKQGQFMEALVGNTKLDLEVLKQWYVKEDTTEEDNVDNSMSEDESTQRKQTEEVTVESKESVSPSTNPTSVSSGSPNTTIPEQYSTPHISRRSAAKRAAAKLHEDMSDLNQYQQMTKSSRKMKEYMSELEHLSSSPNKEFTSPVNKKYKHNKKCEIIAIMTGCESIIELTSNDVKVLQNIGIEIISDLSRVPNTLIAPKILRTEKFLRSLAKVDQIIHPNYLIDVLKHTDDIDVHKYTLDKVAEIDFDLKTMLSSPNKGRLFQDLQFNLSTNLNGSVDVISRILQEHGMEGFQEIKSVTKLSKNLIDTTINSNNQIILIANKTKDTKLINTFKKQINNGIVLEWDWCVKSIFKMELQNLDEYKL